MTDSPASRLVDGLLGEGEAVDEGHFTLDPAAAAAKLDAFAYPDRSRYLIPLVQGLLGLGAAELVITREREDLRVCARGLSLAGLEARLVDLYGYALGRAGDPAARALGRLAIGVDMVLGTEGTERALVRCAGTAGTVELELRRRAAPERRPGPELEAGGLEVIIDRPWLRRLDREADEHELGHLREAVRFTSTPIRVDGVVISQAARDWFETETGEGPGYRFHAGLEQVGERATRIELWAFGVCSEVVVGEGLGFTAVIELDEPRHDLSQLRLIRSEALSHALTKVEGARRSALTRLERAQWGWTALTRPPAWPRARVERVLGRGGLDAALPVEPRIARAPIDTQLLLMLLDHDGARAGRRIHLAARAGAVAPMSAIAAVGIAELVPPLVLVILALVTIAALGLAAASVAPLYLRARQAIRARDRGVRVQARVTGFVAIPTASTDPRRPARGRLQWAFVDDRGRTWPGSSLARAADEASAWPIDAPIWVYYEPERPDQSWCEADIGPRRDPSP